MKSAEQLWGAYQALAEEQRDEIESIKKELNETVELKKMLYNWKNNTWSLRRLKAELQVRMVRFEENGQHDLAYKVSCLLEELIEE